MKLIWLWLSLSITIAICAFFSSNIPVTKEWRERNKKHQQTKFFCIWLLRRISVQFILKCWYSMSNWAYMCSATMEYKKRMGILVPFGVMWSKCAIRKVFWPKKNCSSGDFNKFVYSMKILAVWQVTSNQIHIHIECMKTKGMLILYFFFSPFFALYMITISLQQ